MIMTVCLHLHDPLRCKGLVSWGCRGRLLLVLCWCCGLLLPIVFSCCCCCCCCCCCWRRLFNMFSVSWCWAAMLWSLGDGTLLEHESSSLSWKQKLDFIFCSEDALGSLLSWTICSRLLFETRILKVPIYLPEAIVKMLSILRLNEIITADIPATEAPVDHHQWPKITGLLNIAQHLPTVGRTKIRELKITCSFLKIK